ncbi:MAG: type I-MYXAN CRISPR-associated protein Cas6/Cmx6 [Spirochaetota bacterium]
MPVVELKFPLQGAVIPADHGYFLYAALSRVLPVLHQWQDISICGISGVTDTTRNLHLQANSKLRLRIDAEKVGSLFPLAGKSLKIAQANIRLGIPKTQLLKPHSNLYSRLVLIKMQRDLTPSNFLDSLHKQLQALGIHNRAILFDDHKQGFVRKTIYLKGKQLVGYPVLLTGLSPQESLLLQEKGIGGKRKMGCGSFVGVRG